MRRAFWRGCLAGLVVAGVLLLPLAALSWLVEQMDRAERAMEER